MSIGPSAGRARWWGGDTSSGNSSPPFAALLPSGNDPVPDVLLGQPLTAARILGKERRIKDSATVSQGYEPDRFSALHQHRLRPRSNELKVPYMGLFDGLGQTVGSERLKHLLQM